MQGSYTIAEEITRSVSTPNVQASGTVSNTATATTGATVTREPGQVTISGIASAVGVVDTRTVQGSASGTLRIRWGRGTLERQPMLPPGAPEMNGLWMFGVGFVVFGFGLLRTRKYLW